MELREHIIEKLDVLIGLRGCGKSSWAKSTTIKRNMKSSRYAQECRHIDMSTIRTGPFGARTDRDILSLTADCLKMAKNIIFDDSTIRSTHQFMDFMRPYVDNKVIKVNEVVIHVWNPDADACIFNCEGVLSESECNELKCQVLIIQDLDKIKELFGCEVSIERHKTEKKPDWKRFCSIHKIKLVEDRYMYSDSWCLGGCAFSDSGEAEAVSPDDPPAEFDEFEDLINKLCPSITLKNYRKLHSCCGVRTSMSEYEDEIYHSQYICDMEQFYQIFCSLGEDLNSTEAEIEIFSDDNEAIGTITFKGTTEADVYEKIRQFKGEEIF